jgi:hypothetical protein
MSILTTKSFEHPIHKWVKYKYPNVSGFKIDTMPENVVPVEYDAGYSWNLFGSKNRGDRNEYPPVVSWRVGVNIFKYVLHPRFKEDSWHAFLCGGVDITADYTDEQEIVMQLLKWSSEGYSSEEMNKMLMEHRRSLRDNRV